MDGSGFICNELWAIKSAHTGHTQVLVGAPASRVACAGCRVPERSRNSGDCQLNFVKFCIFLPVAKQLFSKLREKMRWDPVYSVHNKQKHLLHYGLRSVFKLLMIYSSVLVWIGKPEVTVSSVSSIGGIYIETSIFWICLSRGFTCLGIQKYKLLNTNIGFIWAVVHLRYLWLDRLWDIWHILRYLKSEISGDIKNIWRYLLRYL